MALYVPAGRHRRHTLAFAAIALAVGLAAGVVAGRASAPSVDERVRSVQADARRTAAGLRVLALHDEAGAISNQTAGAGGADLVLGRTRRELERAFSRAPWLGRPQRDDLLAALDALGARPDRTSAAFGAAADALAGKIEATFGAAP